MQWRWIDRGAEDGPTQMAIDQAMILDAKESLQPTFRVYQWQPYCISLGFHQSSGMVDLHRCESAGIDVVRRPTGGRAVFHAEELTYSAIIPFGSDWNLDTSQSIYSWISHILAEAIQLLGVPAKLEKRQFDFKNHYQSAESNSCFSAAARHEVMIGGKKLIGSAQRKYPWGVLQHGSILLGDTHLNLPQYFKNIKRDVVSHLQQSLREKTSTLNSQRDQCITIENLSDVIRRAFKTNTDIDFVDGDLSDGECRYLDHFRSEATILNTNAANHHFSKTGS